MADLSPLEIAAAPGLGAPQTVVNSPPALLMPLPDQFASITETLRFAMPLTAFGDADGSETLQYSLSISNGSALPGWMRFIAGSLGVVGAPTTADVGVYKLRLTATDTQGAAVSGDFLLTITSGAADVPGTGTDAGGAPMPPAGPVVMSGGSGDDVLNGGAGKEILDGGKGADVLNGGAGEDVLQMSVDALWPSGSRLTRPGSSCPLHASTLDISGMNRSLDIFNGGDGYDTLLGSSGNDVLRLDDASIPAGRNEPRIRSIEAINMGEGNDVVDLSSTRFVYGKVSIDGGDGNDVIWSGAGDDRIAGGAGNDELDGGAGNDWLSGGAGDDLIGGSGAGNDIHQGGDGNDSISDRLGNNVLDGGAGNDRLQHGNGNGFLAGGRGNDTLLTGAGREVIAYNRGDGNDLLTGSGQTRANDVLSLGGGLAAKDLSLARSGNDLLVRFGPGANDGSLLLDDWYRGNRTVQTLQVIAPPAAGATTAPRTELYDFVGLVAAFDRRGGRSSGNASGAAWAAAGSINDYRLQADAALAYGGELAAVYASQGNLTGVGLDAGLALLAGRDFGQRASSTTGTPLADGTARLT
jgi:Ca2+-binding RTX toxin-like protein